MAKQAEWIETFNGALQGVAGEFARSVGLRVELVDGKVQYSEQSRNGRRRLNYREALSLFPSNTIKALQESR